MSCRRIWRGRRTSGRGPVQPTRPAPRAGRRTRRSSSPPKAVSSTAASSPRFEREPVERRQRHVGRRRSPRSSSRVAMSSSDPSRPPRMAPVARTWASRPTVISPLDFDHHIRDSTTMCSESVLSRKRGPMATDTNLEIVERFDAMLNTGDLTELDELCSPDMANHALAPTHPKVSRAPASGCRPKARTSERHVAGATVVAQDDLVVQFGVRAEPGQARPSAASNYPPAPPPATPRSCTASQTDESSNGGPSTTTSCGSYNSARSQCRHPRADLPAGAALRRQPAFSARPW